MTNSAFDRLKKNRKIFELRRYGKIWNEVHLFKGRRVELIKGYKRKNGRLFGHIGKVVIGSIKQIFVFIDYEDIIPTAESEQEAFEKAKVLVNNSNSCIAFEIIVKN